MNTFWLIKQSLILDYKFFIVSHWPIHKKLEFILKKYLLLCKHHFTKVKIGKDSLKLFGENIFYGSKFGISDYQGILARHQKLISLSDLKIPKKAVIVDIGANVGFFSKLARDLYPNARIYAVEPVPVIFGCLKKNFNEDRNILFFNIAISQKNGKEKMEFDPEQGDISRLSKKGNLEVETKTLDEFILNNNIHRIDLLKIDTEGFEQDVLEGAKKALAQTHYLFIEVTLENNPRYTLSSIMTYIYSENYNFNLLAFRNFGDTAEGKAPILDCLLENVFFKR